MKVMWLVIMMMMMMYSLVPLSVTGSLFFVARSRLLSGPEFSAKQYLSCGNEFQLAATLLNLQSSAV
jgi:hypothetical protein